MKVFRWFIGAKPKVCAVSVTPVNEVNERLCQWKTDANRDRLIPFNKYLEISFARVTQKGVCPKHVPNEDCLLYFCRPKKRKQEGDCLGQKQRSRSKHQHCPLVACDTGAEQEQELLFVCFVLQGRTLFHFFLLFGS